MARVDRSVGGKPLEEYLAGMNAVQWETENRALEVAMRAEDLLRDHRQQQVAHIDLEQGDIDSYVTLVDSEVTNTENAKSNTALSIEFGREGFVDPDTGEEWGASEGLYILTRAANLRRPKRAKSRRVVLSKKAFFAAANRRKKKGDE